MSRHIIKKPTWTIRIYRKKDEYGPAVTYTWAGYEEDLIYEGSNKTVERLKNGQYVILNDKNEREICFTPRQWESIPDKCFSRNNNE